MDMEHDNKRSKTILLCDDLVSAILVRLPVKSLVRFTCVSKSWNSLIRNPTFVSAHVDFHKNNTRRYLLHRPSDPDQISPYLTTTTAAKRRLKPPFTQHNMVAGSCEGLVCLYSGPQDVGLWNPFLQVFKILPPSPSCSFNEKSRLIFGLGYSRKNNDHRVLKIIYNTKDISANKVEIYSMKSNSWKSIECPAPLLAYHETGVFTNGRINWIACPRPGTRLSCYKIMWFDIEEELFGQSAESWNADGKAEARRFPFREEVFRLQQCKEEKEYSRMTDDLWKMKTLASENSWVRLKVLPGLKELRFATMFDGERMLPECYDKNIRFLGISISGMPWEEENDSAPSARTFQIVCVTESLRLLDHNNM